MSNIILFETRSTPKQNQNQPIHVFPYVVDASCIERRQTSAVFGWATSMRRLSNLPYVC